MARGTLDQRLVEAALEIRNANLTEGEKVALLPAWAVELNVTPEAFAAFILDGAALEMPSGSGE